MQKILADIRVGIDGESDTVYIIDFINGGDDRTYAIFVDTNKKLRELPIGEFFNVRIDERSEK